MRSIKILMEMLVLNLCFLAMTACATPKNAKPKCLAIGSARTVMIREDAEIPGHYHVTVKGSNPQTVLLTHSPQRSSKTVSTGSFLERWEEGYHFSAPNVTFTSVHSNVTTTNILVLSNPTYDEETHTITFEGSALEPEFDSVQTGVFSNVTITYDSQVQSFLLDQKES